jgi:hypothetical protein
MSVQSMVLNATPGAICFPEVIDAAGVLAFVHKQALLAAVNGVIDASADDRAALSIADREKRSSAVQSE